MSTPDDGYPVDLERRFLAGRAHVVCGGAEVVRRLLNSGGRAMKLSVEIIEFKAICKGTLRGFAVIAIPELKMQIREVGLFEKNTSRWASLPSRPQIGRDGNLRRNGDGQVLYRR